MNHEERFRSIISGSFLLHRSNRRKKNFLFGGVHAAAVLFAFSFVVSAR
jgi:hypothetical protein